MPRKFSAGTSQIKYSEEEGKVPGRTWWERNGEARGDWGGRNKYSGEALMGAKISYEGLLLTLCSLKYRPQALHTGSPLAFLRHSVVVVVWQFAHDVPARLAADCPQHNEKQKKHTQKNTSHDHVMTQSASRFILTRLTPRSRASIHTHREF